MSAAINSSFSRVSLVQPLLWLWQWLCVYSHEGRWLHSKPWRWHQWTHEVEQQKYHLGMVIVVATWMSFTVMSYLSHKSYSSSSSQSTCFCQRDCMNNFAGIITGDRNPNGSEILENRWRTSCLVSNVVLSVMVVLEGKLRVSVVVFHCKLRMLTVVYILISNFVLFG